MARLLKIALTGGIATGKSYVQQRFMDHSVPTIDADELARALPKRHSEALEAIVRRFGQAVLHRNGTLNRRALAAIVFANPDARHDLEAILHPAVYRGIHDWFEHLDLLNRHRMALAVIPLLFESGRQAGFDKVIVTACREDQQIARVMARDGLSEDEARQRLAAQMPTPDKVAKADYVIDTSGTKEETNDQIDVVFDQLVDLVQPAGTPPPDPRKR
jgi:dephospho-CoA kinase